MRTPSPRVFGCRERPNSAQGWLERARGGGMRSRGRVSEYTATGRRLRASYEGKSGSRPVSRVLSGAIIHLGPPSPAASSDLPGSAAGHGIASLFGLATGGVYLAAACYHLRGALLPHHFTLTPRTGRYIFCCTFRGLAPPRRYLAPCPVEPGLSSPPALKRTQRLPGRLPLLLSRKNRDQPSKL